MKQYRFLPDPRGIYYSVILTLILAFSFSIQGVAQEKIMIPLNDDQADKVFAFENPKGSVKIIGYEGNVILVTAIARYPDDEINAAVDVRLNHETRGKMTTLYSDQGAKTIDFDIKVPRQTSLQIRSRDNGIVEIYRIDGEVEVDNTNGHIHLENIRGSAVLNSVYGNITARFKEVTPGAPMMLTSLEGDIELVLPDQTNATLKMKSVYGKIETELSYTETNSDSNDLLDWTIARLNKGGAEYFIRTYQGQITLKKAEQL